MKNYLRDLFRACVLAIILGVGAAMAQQPAQYVAPDEAMWNDMIKAASDLPMSFDTHVKLHNIFVQVQQQLQARKAATTEPPKQLDPAKK